MLAGPTHNVRVLVAASAEGRKLLCAGLDGALRLWAPGADGKPVCALEVAGAATTVRAAVVVRLPARTCHARRVAVIAQQGQPHSPSHASSRHAWAVCSSPRRSIDAALITLAVVDPTPLPCRDSAAHGPALSLRPRPLPADRSWA